MITLRYRLKDLKVQAAEQSFKTERHRIPRWVIHYYGQSERKDIHAQVKTAVESLGLTAMRLSKLPSVPMHEVDLPRLAVYSTWGNTQEVGWVRHALDKFEVPLRSDLQRAR